jgi:hypothetical protein
MVSIRAGCLFSPLSPRIPGTGFSQIPQAREGASAAAQSGGAIHPGGDIAHVSLDGFNGMWL